jgi:hypothetical protein
MCGQAPAAGAIPRRAIISYTSIEYSASGDVIALPPASCPAGQNDDNRLQARPVDVGQKIVAFWQSVLARH